MMISTGTLTHDDNGNDTHAVAGLRKVVTF